MQLMTVGLVLAVLAGLTYAAPPLHRFRPWIAGEPLPILRHFLPAPEDELTEEAAIAIPDEALEALAAEEPPFLAPVGETLVIDPTEYAELPREIEDPSGAMRSFYRSLLRTARAEENHLTRVAHFGDSTIALDGITMTVRERMQQRFGDGGHGFVLAARGHLPYRHHMVRHESEGSWHVLDLTHLVLGDGRYGLGGVQSRAVTNASAWFATDDDDDAAAGRNVSRFDVLYQRHERGGRFRYRVDEGEWTEVDTRSETLEDALLRVEVPDGPHRLSLRISGHGESRLYGVVLERAGPGVVYDSLGIVGARAARMLGFDRQHLARQLEQRETDLVVVAFGGNDADDARSVEDFEATFRDVARLIRAARPSASCLFLAPLDQAERDERGRVRTLPAVARIVTAMRTAALAEGCAYYDTFEAMGGAGSMSRWARMGLASSDYRHATPGGYRAIGNLFYQALLQDFAAFLADDESAPSSEAPSPEAPSPEAPSPEAPSPEAPPPEAPPPEAPPSEAPPSEARPGAEPS